MLSPGVVLNDRYLLGNRVATGGMGDVWSATDTLLKRRVAVKVLLPALVSDTEFITRFRTEARLMAALRHPGIVGVYDYGEDAVVDGRRVDYLVMEFIDGMSLAKRIKAVGRLGVAETLSVLTQAAQALHVAHQASIVHRDVKPSNLLVQPDGSVVLVDFGVARSANVTSITASNIVLGSAHYMAPEQIAGRPVSAATDVYALGGVAYCCLTGRPPFTGGNPLHIVTQHLQEAPPALPPDVPAPVAMLVNRALAKEPADRYPSAAAFAEAARAAEYAISSSSTVPLPSPGPLPVSSPPPPPSTTPLPAGALPSPGTQSPADAQWSAGTLPSAGARSPGGSPGWRAGPGHTGPTLPAAVPAGPSTGGGRRRRVAVLAGVAATVVAVVGLVALLVGRPGPEQTGAEPQNRARIATSSGEAPGGEVEETEPAAQASASAGPNRPASTAGGPGRSPGAQPAEPGGGGKPAPGPGTTRPAPEKNPHTPGKVCGGGYQVVDSATLTGPNGAQLARVYLLYNNSNGNNCTVALKTSSVGVASQVSAYLEVQGASRRTDSGAYEYYAGPVRAKAAGVCVRWGGSAGGVSYNSSFEHCG
ncbi:serine/threonine-protein kinase [Plantactinospora sp. BB1]|uniref:serine/threonine-protein kinase n=1 Tax=Plantactinospora sp. BB1 TaxID=2071627 RepID=UPI000D1752CC|nr:serine/threonine protein kinase [Plantactinospora sp. BB1]